MEAELVAATSPPARAPDRPTDATKTSSVALLGGAGILGGTGALLLGAKRFLLAS